MSTTQETIQNNNALNQSESDNSPAAENEALDHINAVRNQVGLDPVHHPRVTKAAEAKGKPKRQLRKRRSRSKAVLAPSKSRRSSDFSHESRCTVCRHEYRDAIEEEFLHWGSPYNIAMHYGLSERAVYRHAHALKLYDVRDRKLRFALGGIIERADRIPMTPDAILRAIHAFARVNSKGQWIEPPKQVIFSSASAPSDGALINATPAVASPKLPRQKKLPAAPAVAQLRPAEDSEFAAAANSTTTTQHPEPQESEPAATELPGRLATESTERLATESIDAAAPLEPLPAPRRFDYVPW